MPARRLAGAAVGGAGEAGTAADAPVRIPVTRPDVAVPDVGLPDSGGAEVCAGRSARRASRSAEPIGEGLTGRRIGERPYPAEKTIKNYDSGLLAELGMRRRSRTAAYVARTQAGKPAAFGGGSDA
ncbi:hypothetical protein [Streptomyces sp. NPDC096012]|uniref:hypothetical protein n=1 Tax=Streptomyces sp. NPDC096012 TaxID=3155684 RepID=UPI00336A6605